MTTYGFNLSPNSGRVVRQPVEVVDVVLDPEEPGRASRLGLLFHDAARRHFAGPAIQEWSLLALGTGRFGLVFGQTLHSEGPNTNGPLNMATCRRLLVLPSRSDGGTLC